MHGIFLVPLEDEDTKQSQKQLNFDDVRSDLIGESARYVAISTGVMLKIQDVQMKTRAWTDSIEVDCG